MGGVRASGSHPPEEVRPSKVFSTCHKPFSTQRFLWAHRAEPPELQRPALCRLRAFSCIFNQAKLSRLMPPCWELEKPLILQGPLLLLGSRDSWKPDSCVCLYLEPSRARPGCSEARLTCQGAQEGVPPGARSGETTLRGSTCPPSSRQVSAEARSQWAKRKPVT